MPVAGTTPGRLDGEALHASGALAARELDRVRWGGAIYSSGMGPPSSHEPDRSRGSDDSLYRLYELVPVAEEVDIVEDWDRDRLAEVADFEQHAAAAGTDEDVVRDPGAEPVRDGEDPDGPMTQGQVLGLLEHRLGAERLDDEEPTDGS